MGLPRINQRNILMLVLPMSLFLFIDFSQDLSLEPCSCEPGVSGVSDVSAYDLTECLSSSVLTKMNFPKPGT